MRIKICGITSGEDAMAAADAGADAVGLNFVGGTRQIELAQADRILAALPPFVTPVALLEVTGGPIPERIGELLRGPRVSHLQMYGQVTPTTVSELQRQGFRTIYVQPVPGEEFPAATRSFLQQCGSTPPSAILLDAYDETLQGGTGHTIDWDRIARAKQEGALNDWPPLILAGGLTPDNVAEAVAIVRPWGVDVSSGVEDSPGRKSPRRMREFVKAAR